MDYIIYICYVNLLRKIKDNSICKIEVISILSDQPLVLTPTEGNFSQNIDAELAFDQTYFTAKSCYLEETGKDTDAGFQYLQEFGLKIPTNKDRIKFLKYFRVLRLIRLHCSDETFVEIGRNDLEQNVPMKGSFETDENFTLLKWSVQTVFPFDFKE